MHCTECGHDNKDGAKFCNECGTKLQLGCPACAAVNPPGSQFCNECGTPLAGQSSVQRLGSSVQKNSDPRPRTSDARLQTLDPRPVTYTPAHLAERIRAEQVAMEARGTPDGERKTITALFADIKGSTALLEDLDPEDARRIIDPALKVMMDAVHRYEGYVAQSLGDGIFALFGAPIAHEDHAHRALYAALLMQEESKKQAEQLRLEKGINVQIRVGINTGEVVVRSIRKDDLHTDYVPVGHSTNIASRMENLATPGTIVVSEHTHKLTDGYFEFKSLGAAQVKGASHPLKIYEVVGVGALRTKLQVAARRGLARFVGRQHEIESLQKALEWIKAGHGQIVGVMGEPGVGKSRLFHEFKVLHQAGCLLLETFSVSHDKAYPYLPLIDLLKNYFQLSPRDDERQRREKLTGKVLTLDRSLEDILPYLFYLLGIAEPTSSLQQMDPQIRRKRTLEAIKRLLIRESLNQPLILIFEDLHWLDNETQAFLTLLGESIASARILLLVNYRPEYRHEWGSRTYYTQLRLDPLGQNDAEEMLTVLLEEKMFPLPSRPVLSEVEGERDRVRVEIAGLHVLKKFILDKTQGNPFFMEEIVQALAEQGILADLRRVSTAHHLSDLHIPPTVQAVLASRIDRLPPDAKDLLQTLAVIGKEFPLGLLKQVVDHSEDTLQRLLSHLRDAEFIYEQPAFLELEYVFKHALTQEVAYNSLLQERRKVLHGRAATAIETIFHERLNDHYSELASHYSRSGNTQKAVDYLQLAGQQAVQRSANTEAINHLAAALDLLRTLPDTPERDQQELALQIALGAPLMVTKGFAAPEVERAYSRARELCRKLGETPQLFPVLWGLRSFYQARAEYQTMRELAEQLLSLARSVQDPALLLEAHFAGGALYFVGELFSAREHLEQAIALYEPQKHHSHTFFYGQDPGALSLSIMTLVLWHLGYPDQAMQKSHEALTLAKELAHPFSSAFALTLAATLHQFRHEEQVTRERAEAAIALGNEHGFALMEAFGTYMRGWALVKQGQGDEGIAQLLQGISTYQATGAELARSYHFVLLSEAYGTVGQPEKGLAVFLLSASYPVSVLLSPQALLAVPGPPANLWCQTLR